MCRVHRAPSSEGGAGSTKRRCDLFGTPWGPCLECSREVSPRGLPLLENQPGSQHRACICLRHELWAQSCMHCLRRSDGDAAPPPPTSLRGR